MAAGMAQTTSRPQKRALDAKATKRIARELYTVKKMIEMYCRGHHHAPTALCGSCASLWDYVEERAQRCPFAQNKPTCLNCTVHCFKKERRDEIGTVMRYAGPRMLWRHPVLAVLHLLDGKKAVATAANRAVGAG
jgi:hypothetical protein